MNTKLSKTVITLLVKSLFIFALLVSFIPAYSVIAVEILSTNPSPLIAGDYGDITIKVSNVQAQESDQDYENVYLDVGENPYVRYVESTGKEISRLRVGEVATRTVRLYVEDSTPEGFFEIPVQIRSGGDESIYYQPIYIQGEESRADVHIGKVSSQPQSLTRDSIYNTLQVELINLGEKDASSVLVEMKEQGNDLVASYSYSNSQRVGEITQGEVVTAEFVMDISKDVQDYVETELVVTYREEVTDGTFEVVTKTLPITVDLAPLPDFEVVSVEQISDFKHETVENIVNVVLKNNGNQKAEDVRIRIIPDKSFPFIFEESTIYAQSQVLPGEEVEVVFKTEVTAGDPKDYQMRLVVESLVNFDTHVEDEFISITTTQGEDNFNSMYLFIVFGIIIVFTVGIGLRNYFFSKKHTKKD